MLKESIILKPHGHRHGCVHHIHEQMTLNEYLLRNHVFKYPK